MKAKTFWVAVTLACAVGLAQAQIVTGSNGSDGALDYSSLSNIGYSTNIVINMADHPTGIYQYTYVNIPQNVTVSFIPNANNTPVYWLVQSNVIINGIVNVSGQIATDEGGLGGPGGYAGGNGGVTATDGQGPGGGSAGSDGANASYGTLGGTNSSIPTSGVLYGNVFLIPLLGGSGGGGSINSTGGGGGGGAILIATSGGITLNGSISAIGGSTTENTYGYWAISGGGSGGAVRLFASSITGYGAIYTRGGVGEDGSCNAGSGRVRFDTLENNFGGGVVGVFTQGFQPIIIPTSGQGTQLLISSIGGVSVSPTPSGQVITPDAVLSAQQNNPIPIVVSCVNLPLDSLITVSVMPSNGASVSGTGYNNTGTLASSTATISINIPRGGGLVYATATTGN